MSSFQQPYSQGLVPVIQQMQPSVQMQMASTAPQMNAGHDEYLKALQDQIRQTQQNSAQNAQEYVKSQNDAAKKDDGGGGFMGNLFGKLIKGAITTAIPGSGFFV